MVTVHIPPQLRKYCEGGRKARVQGATIGDALRALEEKHPGILAKILDGDQLRPGLVIAVDGTIKPRGLHHPLNENAEINIVPAASGG